MDAKYTPPGNTLGDLEGRLDQKRSDRQGSYVAPTWRVPKVGPGW